MKHPRGGLLQNPTLGRALDRLSRSSDARRESLHVDERLAARVAETEHALRVTGHIELAIVQQVMVGSAKDEAVCATVAAVSDLERAHSEKRADKRIGSPG